MSDLLELPRLSLLISIYLACAGLPTISSPCSCCWSVHHQNHEFIKSLWLLGLGAFPQPKVLPPGRSQSKQERLQYDKWTVYCLSHCCLLKLLIGFIFVTASVKLDNETSKSKVRSSFKCAFYWCRPQGHFKTDMGPEPRSFILAFTALGKQDTAWLHTNVPQ